MQRLLLGIIGAILLLHAPRAQAQLVQVGPGYVKAPFVRVYSYPDGSSYVRAPFVSVYSGGHYYPHGGHATDEFGQASWQALSQAIRDWRQRLDNDLSQNPSGDFWRKSLKVSEIASLVPADYNAPPPEDVRRQLRAIYDTFEMVASSPDVNGVAGLKSFQMLRAALREYSTPAEPRARGQLLAATKELSKSLRRFETGAAWQQYLLLAPGMTLSKEQLESGEAGVSIGDLTRALDLYDAARSDPQYHLIAELPAFAATRDYLAVYLQQVQTPPSSPPAEELPLPRG